MDTSSGPVKAKKHKVEDEPSAEIITQPYIEEEPAPSAGIPEKVEPVDSEPEGPGITESNSDLEKLYENWKSIIEHAPDSFKRSPALAILRSAGVKPVAFNEDTVVLSFKFTYHKDKIEEPENNKIAAKIIGNFIGRPCQVRCIYERRKTIWYAKYRDLADKLSKWRKNELIYDETGNGVEIQPGQGAERA
jgi:DNA polymerase-3 subunit gamma/tau